MKRWDLMLVTSLWLLMFSARAVAVQLPLSVQGLNLEQSPEMLLSELENLAKKAPVYRVGNQISGVGVTFDEHLCPGNEATVNTYAEVYSLENIPSTAELFDRLRQLSRPKIVISKLSRTMLLQRIEKYNALSKDEQEKYSDDCKVYHATTFVGEYGGASLAELRQMAQGHWEFPHRFYLLELFEVSVTANVSDISNIRVTLSGKEMKPKRIDLQANLKQRINGQVSSKRLVDKIVEKLGQPLELLQDYSKSKLLYVAGPKGVPPEFESYSRMKFNRAKISENYDAWNAYNKRYIKEPPSDVAILTVLVEVRSEMVKQYRMMLMDADHDLVNKKAVKNYIDGLKKIERYVPYKHRVEITSQAIDI
ncbi:hypothetical protein [uncultured Ferrimonas sp.]|uniref:hypothetical protein n=1 Tax=uncultured Ferrimonas sp. TaxID=432640 RepID=UPI00262EB8EB|nr:hypothetical protein [uncultured Ferrimonas sp.]